MLKLTNPDRNLLCRDDMVKLTGVNRGKLTIAILEPKYRFPKVSYISHSKMQYFDEAEVLAWFSENDLKNMAVSKDKKRDRELFEQKRGFDNRLAVNFLSKTRHGIFPGGEHG